MAQSKAEVGMATVGTVKVGTVKVGMGKVDIGKTLAGRICMFWDMVWSICERVGKTWSKA